LPRIRSQRSPSAFKQTRSPESRLLQRAHRAITAVVSAAVRRGLPTQNRPRCTDVEPLAPAMLEAL
jgi:hypothetical protein